MRKTFNFIHMLDVRQNVAETYYLLKEKNCYQKFFNWKLCITLISFLGLNGCSKSCPNKNMFSNININFQKLEDEDIDKEGYLEISQDLSIEENEKFDDLKLILDEEEEEEEVIEVSDAPTNIQLQKELENIKKQNETFNEQIKMLKEELLGVQEYIKMISNPYVTNHISHQPTGNMQGLKFAAAKNRYYLVKFLLSHTNPNKWGPNLDPLSAACESGNVEIVQLLLEKGSNRYNESDNDKKGNPLFIACQNRNLEIAKLLIDYGANPIANANNHIPLFEACKSGNLDLVKLLIEKTNDLEYKDKYEKTAIFYACESGNLEIVKLLLNDYKVKYKHKDNRGNSPLFESCKGGNLNIIKLLIELGINPIEENGGSALLDIAKTNEIKEYLKNLGCQEKKLSDYFKCYILKSLIV